MDKGETVGAAIVITVLGAYFYLNWFVATRAAGFLTDLLAKENDDDVVGYESDGKGGINIWDPVTREGRRFKFFLFLVMLPLVGYANYRFWDPIWATLEGIAGTLVKFAGQFITTQT